jgi:hypothetical protein
MPLLTELNHNRIVNYKDSAPDGAGKSPQTSHLPHQNSQKIALKRQKALKTEVLTPKIIKLTAIYCI